MYERIRCLLASLSTDLHEREEAVRLGLLAAVSGESLFLLGPPGTGKSLIARRLQQAFRDATAFSYLMGRFSTPDEVFGPLSIRALREDDRYERTTAGYLPDADVVFLDEIWKASPPIQNALLTALNERVYRNGTRETSIPLKVFVGASNELPAGTDEAAAFWDRFLIRIVVDPIRDERAFSALLAETGDPYRDVVEPDLRLSEEEYRDLRTLESSVTLPPNVVDLIGAVRSALNEADDGGEPIYVSDRRWKKITGLLRMSAVLHGRARVEAIDCALIGSCAWSTLEERPRVHAIVAKQLAERSGRQQSAGRLNARFEELRTSYQRLAASTVRDTRSVPVVYRDEYFRLVSTSPVNPQEAEEQLLIWHGDVEDLRKAGSGSADLFVYDAGDRLVGSQQAQITLLDDWRLTADGQEYELETSLRQVDTEQQRELNTGERATLTNGLTALVAQIDEQVEALVSDERSLEDAAHSHLFVPVADTQIVLDAIRATVRSLSETRLFAMELTATVSGA